MERLGRCLMWLFWHLKSERKQLEIELQLVGKPLLPPSAVQSPTIFAGTRCELERLRNVKLTGYLPGLSDYARELVTRALEELVEQRIYTTRFPIASLHGCTAGKAIAWPERASCGTMAEMGEMVDDLKSLEGKSGGDIISACLDWPELRLDEGIRLLTDSWHQRFYWCNEGGSHHMAVLCHELQKQRKQWRPEVQVSEYSLRLEALNPLSGMVSIFVVMHEPSASGLDQVFKPLQYRRGLSELYDRLGVDVLSPGTEFGSLSYYDLVIVDHSKKHASLVLRRMREAVAGGSALAFTEFLTGWMDRNQQPQLSRMGEPFS